MAQVAAHRETILDLILHGINDNAEGAHTELARVAASCLRAVLRGSSNDGSGKTAVGVGGRGSELAAAVEACLVTLESAALRCVCRVCGYGVVSTTITRIDIAFVLVFSPNLTRCVYE